MTFINKPVFWLIVNCIAIKLGYEDHGYNKFTFIMIKILFNVWSKMTYIESSHGFKVF